MKNNYLIAIFTSFALVGCGGGAGSGSAASTIHQSASGIQVDSGSAQKGPLLRGSIVTVGELNGANLAPTGISYTYETIDNFGSFQPNSTFTSPYLETTAQGYYYSELSNATSSEWVVLRGLSNVSNGADRAINVNVMTTFTHSRIRTLVSKGMTFNTARAQAQRELLNAFNIYNSADIFPGGTSNGVIQPGNFMELDLGKSRKADQILAAISTLTTYIGQNMTGVNSFISGVAADLADDGLLNNSTQYSVSMQSYIATASKKSAFGIAAKNLNGFYSTPNAYAQNDLSQWADSSGAVDMVIDKFKFSLASATPGTTVMSPNFIAGSDDIGQCFYVTSGALYLDGAILATSLPAANGSKFAIGVTPSAGVTTNSFLVRSPANGSICPSSASGAAVRVQKFTVSGAADPSSLAAMPGSYLGANLPDVMDWNPTPIFTNLVSQGRQFGAASHPWGGPTDAVSVGADGWPTGDFGIYLMSVAGNNGTYKVYFNGQARVSLTASAATTLANNTYDPVKNLSSVDVIRSPGASQMVLTFTNTGSGIKNLQVLRPGYDINNNPLYTNEFIGHIARFKTLRFMDWLHTNNSLVSAWSDRTTLNTHYAGTAGVPWENIIALANQTGKDIWINVPISASDDYVQQLATLIKSTLNSTSKVYLEYSNEVWNSSFTQWGVNNNLATAEVAANPSSPLAFDGTTNANALGYRHTGNRLKQIADIFRGTFGDAAMLTTIRPVLAGQIVQPVILQNQLDFLQTIYGAPSNYLYAIGGAPYFNMGADQTVDGLSVDTVLADMSNSISRLASDNAFEKNMGLSAWFQLPLLAYEGGSDTFGPGSIANKAAASLDPRMLNVCMNYLSTWYASGGQMMMWYTVGASGWDNQYGTWGLTSDFLNTNAPKIQCMDSVLSTPLPQFNARNMVPGTISAMAYSGNNPPYRDTELRYMHPGSYVDYVVMAPAAGVYKLVMTAQVGATGNLADVSLNGQTVASMYEFSQTGWGNLMPQPAIQLSMNKGFNTIRIRTRVETTGFWLSQLSFQ